jgi:MYXO-CTERM domain-containing protein
MKIRRIVSGLLLFTLAPALQAATIFDDFNDGNDTGWTRSSPLSTFGAPGAFTFPGGNSYGIFAPVSPAPGSVGPGRAGSFRNDGVYTDFGISVNVLDWNAAEPDTIIGVLARTSNIGLGTTSGYGALLDVGGSFVIQVITGEVGTTLATTPVAGLTPTADYRILFQGVGQNLTAQLFDLANPLVPLATIGATNATYGSGVNGVFVYDSSTAANHTAQATFDNYLSVPEPSAVALGSLGMAALLRRRRTT